MQSPSLADVRERDRFSPTQRVGFGRGISQAYLPYGLHYFLHNFRGEPGCSAKRDHAPLPGLRGARSSQASLGRRSGTIRGNMGRSAVAWGSFVAAEASSCKRARTHTFFFLQPRPESGVSSSMLSKSVCRARSLYGRIFWDLHRSVLPPGDVKKLSLLRAREENAKHCRRHRRQNRYSNMAAKSQKQVGRKQEGAKLRRATGGRSHEHKRTCTERTNE